MYLVQNGGHTGTVGKTTQEQMPHAFKDACPPHPGQSHVLHQAHTVHCALYLPHHTAIRCTHSCPHILRPMAVAAWKARAAGPTAALSGANQASWSHCISRLTMNKWLSNSRRQGIVSGKQLHASGSLVPCFPPSTGRKSQAALHLCSPQHPACFTCSTARSSSASFWALMPPNTTCRAGHQAWVGG